MATTSQIRYIEDLAVKKTREFKEVKELIVAKSIMSADSDVIKNGVTIAEIGNAMTDYQASQLIDALISNKMPERASAYGKRRQERTIAGLDKIKSDIAGWSF